jgi:hypothetical protein
MGGRWAKVDNVRLLMKVRKHFQPTTYINEGLFMVPTYCTHEEYMLCWSSGIELVDREVGWVKVLIYKYEPLLSTYDNEEFFLSELGHEIQDLQ